MASKRVDFDSKDDDYHKHYDDLYSKYGLMENDQEEEEEEEDDDDDDDDGSYDESDSEGKSSAGSSPKRGSSKRKSTFKKSSVSARTGSSFKTDSSNGSILSSNKSTKHPKPSIRSKSLGKKFPGSRGSKRLSKISEITGTSEYSSEKPNTFQSEWSDDSSETLPGYNPSMFLHSAVSDVTDVTRTSYIHKAKSDETNKRRKSHVEHGHFENQEESDAPESYVTAKSHKDHRASRAIGNVQPEPSSGLQEAIDYLTKTCTEDFIISQAENVRRLEHIVQHLTKASAGGCILSQADNLKRVEDCLRSQGGKPDETTHENKPSCQQSANQLENTTNEMRKRSSMAPVENRRKSQRHDDAHENVTSRTQRDSTAPVTQQDKMVSLCAFLRKIDPQLMKNIYLDENCCLKTFADENDFDQQNTCNFDETPKNIGYGKKSSNFYGNEEEEDIHDKAHRQSMRNSRMSHHSAQPMSTYSHFDEDDDQMPCDDSRSQRKFSQYTQRSKMSISASENMRSGDSRRSLANRKASFKVCLEEPNEDFQQNERKQSYYQPRMSCATSQEMLSSEIDNVDDQRDFQEEHRKSLKSVHGPNTCGSNQSISHGFPDDNVIGNSTIEKSLVCNQEDRNITSCCAAANVSDCILPTYYMAIGAVIFVVLVLVFFSSIFVMKSNQPVSVHFFQLDPNIKVKPIQQGAQDSTEYYFRHNNGKSKNHFVGSEEDNNNNCEDTGDDASPEDITDDSEDCDEESGYD